MRFMGTILEKIKEFLKNVRKESMGKLNFIKER